MSLPPTKRLTHSDGFKPTGGQYQRAHRLNHSDLFLSEMVEKGLWHWRLSLVPTTFRGLLTVSLQPENIFFWLSVCKTDHLFAMSLDLSNLELSLHIYLKAWSIASLPHFHSSISFPCSAHGPIAAPTSKGLCYLLYPMQNDLELSAQVREPTITGCGGAHPHTLGPITGISLGSHRILAKFCKHTHHRALLHQWLFHHAAPKAFLLLLDIQAMFSRPNPCPLEPREA